MTMIGMCRSTLETFTISIERGFPIQSKIRALILNLVSYPASTEKETWHENQLVLIKICRFNMLRRQCHFSPFLNIYI